MKWILLTLSLMAAKSSLGDTPKSSFEQWIHHLPGYSAELSLDFCKLNFPHPQILRRAVTVSNQRKSFDLFAFTMLPFDPKKPSVITIHGGPGGLWGPNDASELANMLHGLNVIFFHYRGGGCSDFRNRSSAWNDLLNSDGVIEDIEAIRESYGVAQWQGVLGWSYGTNIARGYSKRFPERAGILVLEGLDDPHNSTELSDEQQIQRMISIIEARLRTSKFLNEYTKSIDTRIFVDQISAYLGEVSPQTNFGYAALWEQIEADFENYYRQRGLEKPKILSLPTFLAISILLYEGDDKGSDVAILTLMDQFDVISLEEKRKSDLMVALSTWEKLMFPFKHQNYSENLNLGMLLSWRVMLKMRDNDINLPKQSLCTSQPMIVLNGTMDLATPLENVDAYLKDKSCAKARSVSVTIEGGGHSNLGSVECLSEYVRQALLEKRTDVSKPRNCSKKVVLKDY